MSENRLKQLEDLKKLRESGKFPGIPIFHKYTRFGDYMPALIRGVMYLISAHSGIGKTQFWKDFFLFLPIQIMKKFPQYGIKLKFIIFLLEETEEEFIDSLYCGLLYREKGIRIDPLELKSMKKNPLSDDMLKHLQEIQPLVDEVLSMCIINSHVYNPTGMYKFVRSYALDNGEAIYENRNFEVKDEHGNKTIEVVKVFKSYKPKDPDEYVFVITDHISLLQEEKNLETGRIMDLRETMEKWSFDYCRKQISKNFNYIVVNIQQQVQSSDQQEFYQGRTIIDKLKPSAATLADCKTTFRDHLVVLGLFNPNKHGLEKYPKEGGYDITTLGNAFRSVIVLKNRIGRDGLEVPLYFVGSSNYFKELPKPDEMNYEQFK